MARDRKQSKGRDGNRPLKRVVVKEEFVALTGHHEKALILAQIEYWHQIPQKIDRYLEEELERARKSGQKITHTVGPTEGWIYKDTEELIEETMLKISRQTMRRRLKELVDAGWVLERHNPNHTWDQTLQYRLDLLKIRKDLRAIGYELQGWVLDVDNEEPPDVSDEDDQPQGATEPESGAETPMSKLNIAKSSVDIAEFSLDNRKSRLDNRKLKNEHAIPEITSETTSEIDLPSVDQSAHQHASEEDSLGSELGLIDRPTDETTNEKSSEEISEPFSVQLLEEPQTNSEDSTATDLSPKEDADNVTPEPEEALRQQAEEIPASGISEEAQGVTGRLLDLLPNIEGTDKSRVMRLAEHYHRKDRISVLEEAAQKVAARAEQEKINHPWFYLTKTCAEKESLYSEEDQALLNRLAGEKTSSSPQESQTSEYEWPFSGVGELDAGDSNQRGRTPDPDPAAQEVWEKVLEDVSDEINAPSLRVWFEGTIPVSLSEEILTVSVPNNFAKEYIESRFKEMLESALSKHLSPTSSMSSLEIVVGVKDYTHNTDEKGT